MDKRGERNFAIERGHIVVSGVEAKDGGQHIDRKILGAYRQAKYKNQNINMAGPQGRYR